MRYHRQGPSTNLTSSSAGRSNPTPNHVCRFRPNEPHTKSGNPTQSSYRVSTLTSPSVNEVAKVLDKDGHLLPEEKQCRMDQGLCLICSKKGHITKDCFSARNNRKSVNLEDEHRELSPKPIKKLRHQAQKIEEQFPKPCAGGLH